MIKSTKRTKTKTKLVGVQMSRNYRKKSLKIKGKFENKLEMQS